MTLLIQGILPFLRCRLSLSDRRRSSIANWLVTYSSISLSVSASYIALFRLLFFFLDFREDTRFLGGFSDGGGGGRCVVGGGGVGGGGVGGGCVGGGGVGGGGV